MNVSVNCDISFSGRVARGVSGELGKRDASWRADAHLNYSNCEDDAYPSPCSQRWKDEIKNAEAREKENGVHWEKVILSRIHCARELFISRNVPSLRLTVYRH